LELGVRASRLVVVQALVGLGEARRRTVLAEYVCEGTAVLAEYVCEGTAAVLQGSKQFATGLCSCVSGADATVAASEEATLPAIGELLVADAGPLAGHGWPTSRV